MNYYDYFIPRYKAYAEELKKTDGIQVNPKLCPEFKGATMEKANEIIKPYGIRIRSIWESEYPSTSMDTHCWEIVKL